jgi:hypothetical protein
MYYEVIAKHSNMYVDCYSEHCCLGDDGIKELCKMKQRTELRLGIAAEKADGNRNVYTIDGFKTILNILEKMPKLTMLVMQLPHVKELDIHHKYMDIKRIGDRGAQFIA